MVSNFQQDLKFSHAQSEQPFWREVYKQAFPDMINMTDVRKDGWAQRAGIDRIITTASGSIYRIDEKTRRHAYNDFLLEFISNDVKQTPGWICKDLDCQFIAYAILPQKHCYLWPVVPLQRAWKQNGENWIKQYGYRYAQNQGYRTINCPVPMVELMRKISVAMFFRWDNCA